MRFSIRNDLHPDDIARLETAMKSVDPDATVGVDIGARTVSVESWLMPEEFFVAFYDEDYDATLLEA